MPWWHGTRNKWLNFGGDPYSLSLVTTLAVCLGGGLRSPSAFLVFYGSFSVNTRMSCLVDGLFPSYTSAVDNSNVPLSSLHTRRHRVLTILAHIKKIYFVLPKLKKALAKTPSSLGVPEGKPAGDRVVTEASVRIVCRHWRSKSRQAWGGEGSRALSRLIILCRWHHWSSAIWHGEKKRDVRDKSEQNNASSELLTLLATLRGAGVADKYSWILNQTGKQIRLFHIGT